jgi:FAD/FMN-containing dehydrogenase
MATLGPGDVLDRRTFLRYAGAAAATVGAGIAAGCTTTHGTAAPRTTTTTSRPPSGPPDWRVLAASLHGSLVLPADSSYPTDALLYNAILSPSPAAIAYCANASDVQRCLAFARAHDVPLAARSGGHSYGGYSSCPGLVIDVSPLNSVSAVASTGAGTGTVQVGAGTPLIDIYSQLGSEGYLLPGGSCPSVGIAGLALGGGIGVFGRAYGLTCDHITKVEMVTADGKLRQCGPDQQEDLFWASQGGGGGNFGVVTSFTFSVVPIPDVTLVTLEWPWAAAGEVLASWMQWMPFTPHAMWSNCQLYPSGTSGVVKVTGVFAGSTSACASALSPLTDAIGTAPTDRFVGPEAYLRAMLIEAGCENETTSACASADTRYPFTAKSTYLNTALSDSTTSALITTLESFSSSVPGGGGGLVLDGYGGAINAVAPAATAFVHRSAIACAQYSVTFPSAPPSASVRAGAAEWLSQLASVLEPVGHGSYQNYIDPTLADWPSAYYGANLPRLRQIKGRYDPDDVFHFAQSIPLPA